MDPMDLVLDIVVGVLLLVGCLMSLTAGLGLIRLPDVLSRMHAATQEPSTVTSAVSLSTTRYWVGSSLAASVLKRASWYRITRPSAKAAAAALMRPSRLAGTACARRAG